jgi:putative transposase
MWIGLIIIDLVLKSVDIPNRTYRTEVLDLYLFNNLAQARRITEEWLTIYNTERPHEALNNMTPPEYKTLKQAA